MAEQPPQLSVRLSDGRALSYAEYGDPAGRPVLYFHGSPGSRLEPAYADEAARPRRLRLIAPDRPGFGGSDFQPGRQFDDWPADVAALADALGLGQFAVLGLSGGGPHVIACAVAMPERLTAAVIVSGAGPIDAYIARSKSRLGRFLRRAVLPITRVFISIGIRLMPAALRRTSADRMSRRPDPEVLARPEARELFRAVLLEGLRPGSRGAVQEFDLHSRPWPMDPASVTLAVRLWHGDNDKIVPVDIGRYVADHLPGCRATIITGGGHLLIVDRIEEVLDAIVAAFALAPPTRSTRATSPS
jgi:pimeloyl-ACP methyl ester carboxylesterase